jgi:MraZ protein
MFYGQYSHSIDSKARLIIPSNFREILREKFADKIMVTKGFEKCLFVFPIENWRLWEQDLKNLSPFKAKSRALWRVFYASATEMTCDKQGRIILSKILLDYAGIKKGVSIIGVFNRFEIWDRSVWAEYSKKEEAVLEETSEKLDIIGGE